MTGCTGFFQQANEALDRGTSDVLLLLAGITEMVERDGAIPVIASNDGGHARRVANDAETIPRSRAARL